MELACAGEERERLAALRACRALDPPAEEQLADLVRVAARACGVPAALILLLDAQREWCVASFGTTVGDSPREAAVTPHVMGAEPLVAVPDLGADGRFAAHALARAQPPLRFFAAAALRTHDGLVLGALCIADRDSGELAPIRRDMLLACARQAATLLDMRRRAALPPAEAEGRGRTRPAPAAGEADFRLLAESLPQLVWVCRTDGSVEFINQKGLEYAGRSFEELASEPGMGRDVHPQDLERVASVWAEALETGESFELEARLRRHDGACRWHLIRGHPVIGEGGRVVRWLGTATDVHDVKESNERSAFLLALSTELSGISDPQELVCRAMQRLQERLQATCVTLAEVDDPQSETMVIIRLEGEETRIEVSSLQSEPYRAIAAEAKRGLVTVVRDTRTDSRCALLHATWYGPRRVGAMVSAPLLRGGKLVALLSAVDAAPRDWTASEVELVKRVADIVWPAFEKARADRTLAMSEERLRLAQNIARIGAWEWDPATDHCYFSPESHELFGFDPGSAHRLSDVMRGADPRDAQAVQAAIQACMENRVAEVEYRYHHPTRGLRWIHTKAGMATYAGRSAIVGISIDVTERKQAEEALKEINQRKDEFLAMLAHELRNPLAPIRNAAQILRVHATGRPELEWARAVIERQARHLTRLVDDLLDVSRIVRGQIVLEKGTIELAEIVHHAVETSRPLVRMRRHRLEVRVPETPVRLEGDLTRLSQVLANLLINAAKYTNEGGQITLRATQEGSEAVVRVRDTGIGIPSSLLPHIFDLFTQGDRTLDRAQGGLGIGLTLVKRIVEMHGGSVAAYSAGLGQGSEFVVRLPTLDRGREPAVADALASAKAAAGRERGGTARGERPLRVLVVDDNVDAAESIALLLGLEGHEVRSVHSAQDALDAVGRFRPDVVLLDIGLPGMDGYEVARRMRSGQAIEGMRLVAVTGYGQEGDRERARAAGFDQHLVKPVEPERLNAILRDLPATRH